MMVLFMITAMASAVPSYDMERSCRSAGPITQDRNGRQGRIAEENAAKEKLIKEWSNYSTSARDTCASSQTGDQTDSYVELYSCFEMQNWRRVSMT